MRALTLWRPWSDAIVHGPKRVENRSWAPPMLGELIAIHAGKKYGLGDWKLPDSYVAPTKANSPTGIVGVARVVGYLDLRKPGRRRFEASVSRNLVRLSHLDEDPWWLGPVGWLLEDVVSLPEPIEHPGSLGLWRVPFEVVERIIEALT